MKGTKTTAVLVGWLLAGVAVMGQGTAPTSGPAPGQDSSAWTDRVTHARLPIWDWWQADRTTLVQDPGQNPELGLLLQMASQPPQRTQFEKADEFALRVKDHESAMQGVLLKPLTVPAFKDTSFAKNGLLYDADREVVKAFLSIQKRTPYPQFVLQVPDADAAVQASVAKYFKGDAAQIAASRSNVASVCSFPLPIAEAKERFDHLSVLYFFRVEGTGTDRVPTEIVGVAPSGQPNATFRPDRVVRVSTSTGVTVLQSGASGTEVWLVDRTTRQRLAVLPLAECGWTF